MSSINVLMILVHNNYILAMLIHTLCVSNTRHTPFLEKVSKEYIV